MNILIGFAEIAGVSANLCRGFRALGRHCDLVTWTPEKRRYGEPTRNLFTRLLHKTNAEWSRAYGEGRHPARIFWKYFTKMLLGAFLAFSIFKYDCFIFVFNRTFSKRWRDLPILKFFRKKIVFIYLGSESRPAYINGLNKNATAAELITMSADQKRLIKKAEQYADYLVNWTPQAHFHERPYVHWSHLGSNPRQVAALTGPDGGDGAVKIIHAPSHPIKGTDQVRQIISRLRDRGLAIDYVEVIGQLNEVVMERLAWCDFVVDAVFSDSNINSLTTEAAWFGKPTVSCGYYHEQLRRDVPEELRMPSVFVHPDRLEEAIEKLVVDREFRLETGRRAREFVEKHCRPELVAEKFLRLLAGDAPKEWFRDPRDQGYLHGVGLSEAEARRMVRAVIREGGTAALGLADKPELEAAFVRFAAENEEAR